MSTPAPYTFRWGEGQISGFLSAALGLLGILAVLCFLFPSALTFPDLNRQYDADILRLALGIGLMASLLLATVNFCIGRMRYLGYIGFGSTCLAMLLGGISVHHDGSNDVSYLPIGLDWFILDLIASALIFIPLERLFILRREQALLREEWQLDLQYFALIHLLVSILIILSTITVGRLFSWSVNAHVQAFVSHLPLWIQFPLVVVAADLAEYWSHRAMHKVPFLWRIHSIHHSSTHMDWLASSRLHLGEVIITRTCVLVPVFILGFSPAAIMLYVIYIGLHAIYVHANVRFTFGFLRFLIVTPIFHHWHHADDVRAVNKNFAVHLPIIDWLFGTYFQPKDWPAKYGIGGEPLPRGLFRQFIHPIMPRRPESPTPQSDG